MGVQSFVSWPCGPDFTPSPNATNGVFRATRREVWLLVLTAGPARCSTALPPSPVVVSSPSGGTREVFAPLPRAPSEQRGLEGVKTMTRMEDDRVARRRDELARDRGSRQVSSVIDVQRRLTARAGRDART
jgi:hypothetical protein